ncbi:hypothetical protein O1Q96_00765 (plasmid) [Streptomyces sp. Qhu-G9]|uniref:hypothetical protein n=1 Tax=Streptomyces sp. Qhu-G9 TaxID=3452799 RepID=UPI0022ABEC7D|nr:hypothetical protein [Streptomyces aurantiacus]WAU78407.1 hypothetical protein O1Q96_00765 [Streptomyces aurantiacus]
MGVEPGNDAARRYAAALKAAVQPLLEAGVTQKRLAAELHFAESTVSRFLNGGRIAPKTFIEGVADFATRRGQSLPDLDNLLKLCEQAEEEGSITVRLRYADEQIERLKDELAHVEETARNSLNGAVREAIQGMRSDTAQQLAGMDQQLQELNEELTQERQRAETAEAERDTLRTTASDQQRRLGSASDLVREMNTDLERQQEEIRLLRQEIKVLRGQVGRLTEEKTVPGVSTQASAAHATFRTGTRDAGAQMPPLWQAALRAEHEKNRLAEAGWGSPLPEQPTPAAPNPTLSPASSKLSTFAKFAIGVIWLICLLAPVFVYLNGAAFAAACASEKGPPWWGLAPLAVADLLFTIVGLLIMVAIGYFFLFLAESEISEDDDGINIPFVCSCVFSFWGMIVGFIHFCGGHVTSPGLWWLHTFGISG